MKLVYVAGPFRGKNAWEVERNCDLARQAGMQLAKMGFVPVIPHSMYQEYDGTLDDDFWIDATLALLDRCDAMLVLPGWRDSVGTTGEVRHAEVEGIPVFYSVDSVDFGRDHALA